MHGVDLLLRNADRALYRAKAKGRNTYQFYVPEMDAMVQAQIDSLSGMGFWFDFMEFDLEAG